MGEPAVSIVLPAYNESARLISSLEALIDHVDLASTEVIVVDDGSTDDTAAIAEAALRDSPCHQILRMDTNRGKGAAIRAGVLAATGRTLVYMDADLATDLNDLKRLVLALEAADVAVGSRTAVDAVVINGTWSRSVMARVFNLMARRVHPASPSATPSAVSRRSPPRSPKICSHGRRRTASPSTSRSWRWPNG